DAATDKNGSGYDEEKMKGERGKPTRRLRERVGNLDEALCRWEIADDDENPQKSIRRVEQKK
ncbi:hypothetical protein Pfo_027301, partial [Paulownia fortunei]